MDHHRDNQSTCDLKPIKQLVPVAYEEVNLLRSFSQLQQRERWKKTGRVNESDFAPQQPIHNGFQLQAKTRPRKSLPADGGGLSTGYLVNYNSIGDV